MSKIPNLSWLQSFSVSAKYLSFSQAANELNLSQAAVSKQIKALEQHFDSQLFIRKAHGLALTESGYRLWLESRDSLGQLGQLSRQFKSVARGRAQIVMRVNVAYATLALPTWIARFEAEHPGVNIKVMSDVWEPGQTGDNADIYIGYGRVEKISGFTRLPVDRLLPLCAADASWQQLPLIHVSGYYYEWDAWLSQHTDFQYDKTRRIDVDNSLLAYAFAEKGLGIALGRSSLRQALFAQGGLISIDGFASIEAGDGFYCRLSTRGEQSPLAKAFVAMLLANC